MELILIYAAVFICGLIVFERVTNALSGQMQRKKSLNYRLKVLEASESNLDVLKGMIRDRALDYDRAGFSPIIRARRIFAQSGFRLNQARIAIYSPLAAAALWILLGFFIDSVISRAAIIVGVGVVLPIAILLRARAKRIRAFVEQLPRALDIVNRSLSAGHPLPTAISLVSREMADPAGSEFGMLSDELTYGTDLDTAMVNMTERVGAEDLKLLAVSISVQRGTGGNLVEVLENLANVIRERAILRAKIRALSAEGRFTAIVMSVFPFGLYFMINALSPTYFDPVWQSGYANIVIISALVIMAIGNVVLYKLVHFDF